MALGIRDYLMLGIGPSSFPEAIKAYITSGLEIAAVGAGPVISLLSSTTPMWQSTLTITGTNFGTDPGTVQFGTAQQTVLTWSDTLITVKVERGQKPSEYRYGVFAGVVVRTALGIASPAVPAQLMPQVGWTFVNLTSVAPIADRLCGEPELAATFQIAYGVTVGTGSLLVRSDASFLVQDTVVEFQAECHNFLGWGRLGAQTFS